MATSLQERKRIFRSVLIISLVVLCVIVYDVTSSIDKNALPWQKLIHRLPVHGRDLKEQAIEKLNYDWLLKKNFLPNFYMRERNQVNTLEWPPDNVYRNGTIVFVHNQKSGGSTIKKCLSTIMKMTNNPSPTLAANPNALNFYTLMLTTGVNKDLARCYVGDSTFGICEFGSKPCSYFTVLRDPYERVISSHNMCRLLDAPQCIMRNATKLSIKQWAIHQGSFFFRQLLANPAFFTDKFVKLVDELRTSEDPVTQNIPPWWRNELILHHLMTKEQKDIVLDFVLDRLQSWFAVIGLTSDYDTSLALFERVYHLPFHSQCAGEVKNKRKYTMVGTQAPNTTKEEITAKLYKDLSSDSEVNQALRYDIEIYRKAKDIFRLQKLTYEKEKASA
ncbi:uncharacterized protein LOC144436982 [Glandiceps talaboti]